MNTKKIILALVIIFSILLPFAICAQRVYPSVYKKYGSGAVRKVYEMMGQEYLNRDLSEASQLLLAHEYNYIDTLVSVEILRQLPEKQLQRISDSIRWARLHIYALNRLQPEEHTAWMDMLNAWSGQPPIVNNKVYPSLYMHSLLGKAIWFRDSLQVNSIQLQSLMVAATNLYNEVERYQEHPELGKFDKEQYDKEQCSRILSDSQYDHLILVRERVFMQERANQDWLQYIRNGGNGKAFDKETIIEEVGTYYLKQQQIVQWKNKDRWRYDSLSHLLKMEEPLFLTSLSLLKKGYPASVLVHVDRLQKAKLDRNVGNLLQLADTLGLNSSQINRLINCAVQIQTKLNYAEEHPNGPSINVPMEESIAIMETVDDSTFFKMERIKNNMEFSKKAEKDWNDIVLRKLNDNTLQDGETKVQIQDYYLKRKYIIDRYYHDNIKGPDMLKTLDEKRPDILSLLYEARKNPNSSKSGYTW